MRGLSDIKSIVQTPLKIKPLQLDSPRNQDYKGPYKVLTADEIKAKNEME